MAHKRVNRRVTEPYAAGWSRMLVNPPHPSALSLFDSIRKNKFLSTDATLERRLAGLSQVSANLNREKIGSLWCGDKWYRADPMFTHLMLRQVLADQHQPLTLGNQKVANDLCPRTAQGFQSEYLIVSQSFRDKSSFLLACKLCA